MAVEMGFSPPIQAIRPKPAAPPIPRNLCPANPATLRHSRRFRHSRESGNPAPKRGRNLSEKTDPPPPSFPRKRESRPQTRQESIGKNRNPRRRHSRESGNPDPDATGIYRKKQKPPPPSFPRRRESRPQTRQESIGKNRPPAAVIPAQAGIQTPNAAGIYRKRLKPNGLDSRLRGNDGGRGFGIPAFAGMTESGGNNERRE
ncbi:putative phage associated protein [Neisseria meningitidis]|nr:putative phage associated protein [Neisseria meningitidis]